MIFLSIVIALLLAWGVQAIVNHLARNEVSSIDYSVLGLEGVLTATTGPTSGEVRLDDSREVGEADGDGERVPGGRNPGARDRDEGPRRCGRARRPSLLSEQPTPDITVQLSKVGRSP